VEYGRCKERLLSSTSENNHEIITRFLDYELVRKDRIEAVKLGRNWFIKKDVLERYANRKRTDAS